MYKRLQESEKEIKEMSFSSNVEILSLEYLEIFEGV